MENIVTFDNVSGSLSSEKLRPHSVRVDLVEEIQRVPESGLIHINIDVVAAVATAFGVLPKLSSLQADIQSLPAFDLTKVEKLEAYATALYETHADYLSATRPTSLPQLLDEATRLRDRLYVDAHALS